MPLLLRLRHIEVFYAVYRCGTISSAARELNVSQPSVSKVLRHAEDQLGYELFERAKRGLVPTPAAHELFEKVKEVYADVRSLNRIAKNIRGRKGGHIRLGVLPSLGLSVVPQAIAEFYAENPEVSFEINTLHSHDVAEALFQRDCDIAIGYGAPSNARLVSRQLGESELLLVTRRDQFRPAGARMTIDELDEVAFIGLRDSGPSGDLFIEQLVNAGINPREVVTARTYYVAMALVRLGVGVSVVDNFTETFSDDSEIESYRFEDPILYPVNAVTAEDSSQPNLIDDFLNTVSTVIADKAVKG